MSNTCGNKLKSSETMKKEDVLQAVVICDNFNSWFEPVSFYIPVPLIPLVNSPILEYSLEFLSLSGVQEVILFCCSHADRFKKYIKNSKWSKRSALMSVSVMVSESCRTLGDAMRDLDAKAVIRSDFILLTADVIANIQLLPILERHRKFAKQDKGAVMTILYKEAGPGHNTRSPEDETVLAVDSSTNRILFHKKVGQTSKKIVFPLETFMDRSKTELLYNLQATRIYLCSPAVPPLFSDNFDFQSLDDFVRGILMNEEILASTIYWHCLDTAEYAAQISTWHMYQAVSHDIIHRWVYPLVPDVTLTASGERYMYLRHNVYQQKSAKLAKGCVLEEDVVLAEDTVIGENTYITSSVIGRNCVIGKNVFVSNSYLWDNVVLEDNSRVEFSVVASGTVLKNGCKLGQGCIVGPETVLDANKDIKNAYLVASTSVLKDDGNENISDRKIVKIGEKAFMYTCITEDSDSEEETKICHPSGLILDSQGESEEESDDDLTGSNDMSYRASPVPDDVNLFFNEVLDSLSRGIEDKLDCDHLILEINSSRYAYNVTVQEVNYNVVRALLSLPSSSTSFAEIKKGLAYFMPILKKYIRNDEAQKDCLQAIEDTIGGKSELWDSLPKLLHILYGNDILEEDAIMEWYNTTDETSPTATAIRKEELEPKPSKPKRLPVVFGRMLDDAVQQLIDLTLQEAIGDWLNDNGLCSEEILLTMKEDVWKLVQNFQERLTRIDLVNLLAHKMITKVTLHFERIRLSRSSKNKEIKVEKLSYLEDEESELNYLKCIAELALTLLLPKPYLEVIPVRHLLKEILICKVIFPAIETLTDPDYINQKILLYVHQPENSSPQRRRSYTYAASFEDFIQMIKDSKDIEVLNQIRSSIMNEITHASTIHSKKKSKTVSANKEVFGHGIARGDFLQGRQVQRYIHQLTYAKSQCEKQLAALGCASCGVEEAMEATALSGRKILQLDTLLENPLCRQFLAEFLDQAGDKLLLKCWEAVEELKQANRCDWHQLATDIFYKYINNPSPAISVEKPVLKRMEQFLLGNQGPEVFYDVQKDVTHVLEEKIYPTFLVSDTYQRMEAALEQIADAEPAEEACLQESDDPLSNTNVVEESSYAHRKLDEIQKRLDDKTQALEALRCNMKPDHSVLSRLESDVETLQGEKRQLEAHLMRTEAWSEHLGRWRAVVQSAEMSEEKESLQFVLVVHVLEDETDSDAVSTGWVVLRRLSEFQELHRKLSQLSSSVKHLELPSQSLKFRFGKSALEKALEKAKGQIQKYLQFVLEDDTLNKSEAIYAFLSPSSEHLKQTIPSPQKPKFAFSTLLKNPLQLVEGLSSGTDITADSGGLDSEDESFLLLLDESDGRTFPTEDSGGRDGIAEPLYDLLGEIFDLKGVFMWLRKTIITFVQITYNKTISRQVRETVTGLFSEHMVYSYIQFIIKSWWIDGKLKAPPPQRTDEQKVKTRSEARDHFLANIPELLTNIVGQQASRRGATKVFDILQDPLLNKHLFYDLLEVVLHEIFPEM